MQAVYIQAAPSRTSSKGQSLMESRCPHSRSAASTPAAAATCKRRSDATGVAPNSPATMLSAAEASSCLPCRRRMSERAKWTRLDKASTLASASSPPCCRIEAASCNHCSAAIRCVSSCSTFAAIAAAATPHACVAQASPYSACGTIFEHSRPALAMSSRKGTGMETTPALRSCANATKLCVSTWHTAMRADCPACPFRARPPAPPMSWRTCTICPPAARACSESEASCQAL